MSSWARGVQRREERTRLGDLHARDHARVHLTQPVPDLPTNLGLNLFCAVPPGTPIVSHGLERHPVGRAVLPGRVDRLRGAAEAKSGLRRLAARHLDAIVFELGVAPKDAAARVASGSLDYVLENDPALAPETAAARGAGPRYRLTPDSTGHVLAFTFNTGRPLFADLHMRRAVQYALDRQALAQADRPARRSRQRVCSRQR